MECNTEKVQGWESPVPPDSPDVSNMATESCMDPEPENAVLLNNKSRTVKLIDFQLSRASRRSWGTQQQTYGSIVAVDYTFDGEGFSQRSYPKTFC